MLTKYGHRMRTIHMDYSVNMPHNDEAEKFQDLIERMCCNLKVANLVHVTKIPRLKGLNEIQLWQLVNDTDVDWNRNTFTEFINNNPQLEAANFALIKNTLLESMDERLDQLKSLTLAGVRYVEDIGQIHLKSLVKLTIDYADSTSCNSILQAMNGNAIKELRVERHQGSFDDIIHEICGIKTIESLQLHECGYKIDEWELRALANQLPQLKELNIDIEKTSFQSGFVDDIQSVLAIFPELTKLSINFNNEDFTRLLIAFEESVNDFRAKLANTNTEIDLLYCGSGIFISKDRIVLRDHNCFYKGFEVHWMENLNESSWRKTIKRFWNNETVKIKIVNNCADRTLDISDFMHLKTNCTLSLDIKSDGPITVNANVSENHWFKMYDANFRFFKATSYLFAGHTLSRLLSKAKNNQNPARKSLCHRFSSES